MLSYDDILAARERIRGQVDDTPCRQSLTLAEITGAAEVWVKFDNLQFTASFKERGALNKLLQLTPAEQAKGVIAASAGNHAQAVAYHGQRLGVPVTIVMPKPSPTVKVEQTRNFGAEVVLEGEVYDDAYAAAKRIGDERGLTYVHAFNDLDVMAGQGVCGIEMLEVAPHLDALVVPIGGGGLISGIAVAAKAIKPDIEIWGVEAAMFPAFKALMRGEPARCGGSTIAEGIAVKAPGDLNLKVAGPLLEDVLLVPEGRIEEAVALYCNVEKTVAEGAGAAALAALLEHPDVFRGKRVGITLCGGNIDTRLLASVLTRELVREKRLIHVRVAGDDKPGMLSTLARVVGDLGGNIVDVTHNRLALDVPAKGAEFDILMETRDAAHGAAIVDALAAVGYPARQPFAAGSA